MTAIIREPPHPSAASGLDADTLVRLRDALASERAIQESIAAERAATVVELTGQTDVDSILEREVAEASAARALEATEEIDGALARMDAGTYGRCEVCGRPIPLARLEAIPHTRFCVIHAAQR
jgi:DnaK suppressor protein